MTCTIELDEMRIYAYHGCFEEEQRVGNWFTVFVSLDVECTAAAQSDNINDALNYVEVATIVKEQMGIKSHLLENVAMRIIGALQSRFDSSVLHGGRIKVCKMAPPVGVTMKSVGVEMAF